MTSEKSYVTEQRLNALLAAGGFPAIVIYNSSDNTGIDGTDVNIGTVGTAANFPVMQVGMSYQVEAHMTYEPTANGPGNTVQVLVEWGGAGAATRSKWSSLHFESGGWNGVGGVAGSAFSWGDDAGLPAGGIGPGMHSGKTYAVVIQGFIYDIVTADQLQMRVTTSGTAVIKVWAGAYVKITPCITHA